MRKSIFPALLCCNLAMAANAAINPIPLLTEQCLRQSPSLQDVNPHGSIAQRALIVERELLSLHNINDRVSYYHKFPLKSDARRSLLGCQLHLADVLASILSSPSMLDLVTQLELSEQQAHRQLALRLNRVQQRLLPAMVKSQLHTAQASVLQGLRSHQLDFTIVAPQCLLPGDGPPDQQSSTSAQNEKTIAQSTVPNDFSRGIAAYLMQQPNPDCRQAVWQAFQGRASDRNSEALTRIYQLRRQQALSRGFDDYALFTLADETLSTPALVKAFLDGQTQNLHLAPWDLGKQLAALPAPPTMSVSSTTLFDGVKQILAPLGLSFEDVTQQITRVWYQERLLGELHLHSGETNSLAVLRYPVIGQQFGQLKLSIKPQQNSAQELTAALQAIARALTILGTGSRFYLSGNMVGTDSAEIASLWLTQFLTSSLPSGMLHQDDRLILIDRYRTQLQVFRAKVALEQYQRRGNISYSDLGGEFYASFGVYWPQTNDYQYSFGQLIGDGPSYYLSLWHRALADLIVNTPSRPDAATIFDVLVVNEASHPLEAQLQALIGAPVDPLSLIHRIQYATKDQNTTHHPHTGRYTGATEP